MHYVFALFTIYNAFVGMSCTFVRYNCTFKCSYHPLRITWVVVQPRFKIAVAAEECRK